MHKYGNNGKPGEGYFPNSPKVHTDRQTVRTNYDVVFPSFLPSFLPFRVSLCRSPSSHPVPKFSRNCRDKSCMAASRRLTYTTDPLWLSTVFFFLWYKLFYSTSSVSCFFLLHSWRMKERDCDTLRFSSRTCQRRGLQDGRDDLLDGIGRRALKLIEVLHPLLPCEMKDMECLLLWGMNFFCRAMKATGWSRFFPERKFFCTKWKMWSFIVSKKQRFFSEKRIQWIFFFFFFAKWKKGRLSLL